MKSRARKRKAGGGRKPKGPIANKAATFSTRITPQTRDAIDRVASETGLSVSQAAERLIQIGLDARRRRGADRPLRALLFLIETLALSIAGGRWMDQNAYNDESHKEAIAALRDEWRTNKFNYRAFKLAVFSLLEALEPKGEIVSPLSTDAIKSSVKSFGSSDAFLELMMRNYEKPENLGAYHFSNLWQQLHRSHPLTAEEREVFARGEEIGQMMLEEHYGLQDAQRDLELG